MDATDSKEAALAVWRTFSTRDPEKIKAVLTDDVEWVAPEGNATAAALGKKDGFACADALIEFITRDFGRLFARDVKLDITHAFADGHSVVIEQRLRATLCNGRPYDNEYCFVMEMAGGRLRRMREYMDTRKGHEMVFGGDPPGRIA